MTTLQTIRIDALKLTQKQITNDIYEVTLAIINDQLKFHSGQYIILRLNNPVNNDPKGNFRTFSIASSPQDTSKISIVFRNSGSIFKQELLQNKQDLQISIEGPFGHFTVAENSVDKIFIAACTGIAPFMSTLRSLRKVPPSSTMYLLFANRNEKEAAYRSELNKISQKVRDLSIDYIYGRITGEQIGEAVRQYGANTEWYVSGPPLMVKEVTYLCQKAGIPYSQIKTEELTGY